MIVMKFGGTSVKNAGDLANVAQIVTDHIHENPLVVLSAGAGVTDALIDIAHTAADSDPDGALERVEALRTRHFKTARNLLREKHAAGVISILHKQFDELETLVKGIAIVRELTPRVLDHFMSFGEQWSCLLFEQKLLQDGLPIAWIDSREILITDDDYNKSNPFLDPTCDRLRQHISPLLASKTLVVTQGFVGATQHGATTTLGRGGSDYTAAIFGSLLHADEIQIWSDVSGVLTADPAIVPDARPVRRLTFNEAAELAYFGAKVLHPGTILPAIKKNIPVRVLNSHRPDDKGTLITADLPTPDNGLIPNGDNVVKSIAHRTGITIIRLRNTRMLMAHGFLAKVFGIFARYKTTVDVIATSEVGISLTIDNTAYLDRIADGLRDIADVQIQPEMAVFSIVGENMRKVRGIAGRIFTALGDAGITIELISYGGSEINVTFVVHENDVKGALLTLHEKIFERKTQPRKRIMKAVAT